MHKNVTSVWRDDDAIKIVNFYKDVRECLFIFKLGGLVQNGFLIQSSKLRHDEIIAWFVTFWIFMLLLIFLWLQFSHNARRINLELYKYEVFL